MTSYGDISRSCRMLEPRLIQSDIVEQVARLVVAEATGHQVRVQSQLLCCFELFGVAIVQLDDGAYLPEAGLLH